MHMYKMQPKTLGDMQNETRWKMHKKNHKRTLCSQMSKRESEKKAPKKQRKEIKGMART